MASVKIPYYTVRNGNGFWEPRGRMRLLGFGSRPCGPDGPEAWTRAADHNAEWQRILDSERAASKPPVDAANYRERGYIYFLRSGQRIKIGFSKNPLTRAAGLKTGFADSTDQFLTVRGTRLDERRLHQRLSAYRMSGEWFAAGAPVLRAMLDALTARTKPDHNSECLQPHSESGEARHG